MTVLFELTKSEKFSREVSAVLSFSTVFERASRPVAEGPEKRRLCVGFVPSPFFSSGLLVSSYLEKN